MGQFFKACLMAGDGEKEFFEPGMADGFSMTEQARWGNPFVNSIAKMLLHKAKAVVWCGGYSNDAFPVIETEDDGKEVERWTTKYGRLSMEASQEIYDALHKAGTADVRTIVDDQDGWAPKVLVDHDRREYFDCGKWFRTAGADDARRLMHPLPLLTAAGNGLGAGDYRGSCMEYVGRWCGDRVSVEDTVPEGFYELPCFFTGGAGSVDVTAGPYVQVREAVRKYRHAYRASIDIPIRPEDLPYAEEDGSKGLPVSISFFEADGTPGETEFLLEREVFMGIRNIGDFWSALEDGVGEFWEPFSRENGASDLAIEFDTALPDTVHGGSRFADLDKAVDALQGRSGNVIQFRVSGNESSLTFSIPIEVYYVDERHATFGTERFDIPRSRFFNGSEETFWDAFRRAAENRWGAFCDEHGLLDVRVYDLRVATRTGDLSPIEAAELLPESVLDYAAVVADRKNAERTMRLEFDTWKAEGLVPDGVEMTEDDLFSLVVRYQVEMAQAAEACSAESDVMHDWLAAMAGRNTDA